MRIENLPAPHQRLSAVVVPVSALRRHADLGIGDVSAVIELISWASRHEVGILQFLPITECGQDGSPYSAISSVALEPTLLDVSPGALVDLSDEEYDIVLGKIDLTGLNEGDIQFARVRQIKLDILWAAWQQHQSLEENHPRKQAFAQFQEQEKNWLEDYCGFRLLMDTYGGSELWDRWDTEIQTTAGAKKAIQHLLESEPETARHSYHFYAYVQWVAFAQWAQVREIAEQNHVWLMGDIPYGLSYYSADVLFQSNLFHLNWCGGAPPEEYFKDDPFVVKWGQNWGIPLFRWDILAEQEYSWWCRRVQKTAEIMHAYRIDHVLGFYRIWGFPWRPERNEEIMSLADHEVRLFTEGRWPGFQPRDDNSQANAEANQKEGHERLDVLKKAAPQTAIIAEDLGTVPYYVRPDLASLQIAGTIVPQWTLTGEGMALAGSKYPQLGFAIYATHDHEPLAVLWDRCQQVRQENGEDTDEARTIHRLCEFFGWGSVDSHRLYDEEIQWAALSALLNSNCCYAGVMITDLFGLRDRFNVPGVVGGRNWRVRLEKTVAEFETDEAWKAKAEKFAQLSKASARKPERD